MYKSSNNSTQSSQIIKETDPLLASIMAEKETEVESGSPAPTTPLAILKELDSKKTAPHDGFLVKIDPNDPACGKWGREQMEIFKTAALSSKTVYSYCFVQSEPFSLRAISGWILVSISVVVQIVIPIGIIVSRQPVASIEGNKICPQRGDGFVKVLAFVLSIYFVVLTLGLCTNKLRGLNFLNLFVALDPMRRACIQVGILAQCAGMFAASLAQYLLFIGNESSYVRLLLQSLAMQFCLTVDQNIVNHQIGVWTTTRLKAITGYEMLATRYGGMGDDPAGPMPAGTLKEIAFMVNSEKCVLLCLVVVGVFFSTTLAVCM